MSPEAGGIGVALDESVALEELPGVPLDDELPGAVSAGEGVAGADDEASGVGSGGGVIDGVGSIVVAGGGGSEERLQPLSARVQASAPAPMASRG
ncbi:MAG: hypothetical protein J0H09_19230 [Burkholderiales bacterium]|nr:hypothetical protein [Burkholderiales bacterium]